MVNEIVTAVASKIKEYLPDYTIYKENPKQNIKEPCAIITYHSRPVKDLLSSGDMGDFFYFKDRVTVNFLHNGGDLLRAVRLSELYLKWLTLPDGTVVHADNRDGQVLDDHSAIVSFTLNYQVRIPPDDLPRAEILQLKTHVKEKE